MENLSTVGFHVQVCVEGPSAGALLVFITFMRWWLKSAWLRAWCDLPLLPKLWADLALMEVWCSWWGQMAQDGLSLQREWHLSNYTEVVQERPEQQGEKKKKAEQNRQHQSAFLHHSGVRLLLAPGAFSHSTTGGWMNQRLMGKAPFTG